MPAPTLGRFRLDRPLGQGGMGVVWRAVHDVDDVAVAVKVQISRNATDPALVAQFHAEVRAIAALVHPAIIEVYDYGTVAESVGELVAGSPWLAMELAPHGTAEALCGTIGWAQQRDILVRLLEALAHAHATGLLHRDVKPSNVLLTDEGAKLADFGLATLESANAGTPAYMAPEQFEPGLADLSPATDLYAVGGLAWALATGHPINAGTSSFHARQFALRPTHVPFRPTHPVPDGLEGWLRLLLRRDAGARFQQAADALVALRRLGEPVAVAPVSLRRAQRSDETAAWVPSGLADGGGTQPWAGEGAPIAVDVPAPEAPPPRAPLPEDWHRPRRRATRHLNGVGLGLYGLRQVPLVGREAERERLWAALTDVYRTGAPRGVILSGAAGSGKSRLAAWLSECALEVGAATWHRAVYGHPAGPRDGLVPMVERWLGCERLDAAAVRARVSARVPEGRDLSLLLRPPPGSKALSDAARLDALCAAVRAMATDRPVVVWLDDAQWGEEAGPFVERILATDVPALLVLTVRAEALEDLPSAAAGLEALAGSPAVTSIPVPVLDRSAQDTLVTALLGLHGAVADLVVARTGGNPLFATQLIGDWVQRGILVPEDGGFVVAEGADVTVPDAIHDLWTERLTGVLVGHAEEARVSLELAALLGVEVDRDEWADVCREAGVQPALDVVEAMEVRGLAVPRGEGWAFVHGMLTESISRVARDQGRMSHHQQVVADIHLGSATRLSDTGRAPEAELLLSRAERLLRESPHRHLWTQIARELALVWRNLGQANRAAVGLSRALESARALGDRKEEGEVLGVMGLLRSDCGDVDGALGLYEASLALHRRVGNRTAEGTLLANMGFAHMQQSRLEDALARYRQAVSIHQAVGNGHGEAKVLGQMGRIYLKQGRTDDAIRACTEALAIARRSGNLMAVGAALGSIGLLTFSQGRIEETLTHIDEALAINRAVGDRGSEGHMLLMLGNVHKAAGRRSQALVCYRHALDITVELGARILEAYVLGEIGDLLVDEADHQTANPHLSRAILIFGEAGLTPEVALYRSRLAQSFARQGDLLSARFELRRVGEAGLHAHRPVLAGQVACMRAEVERLAGDDTAARAALAQAEAFAEAIHATPESEFGQMVAKQRLALNRGT